MNGLLLRQLQPSENERRCWDRDRLQHCRIASGSAEESKVALEVAVACGYVDTTEVESALALLDRVLAVTWRLTHPRA